MASAKSCLARALFSRSATIQATGKRLKRSSARYRFRNTPGT
jgi:hypothetical protein